MPDAYRTRDQLTHWGFPKCAFLIPAVLFAWAFREWVKVTELGISLLVLWICAQAPGRTRRGREVDSFGDLNHVDIYVHQSPGRDVRESTSQPSGVPRWATWERVAA